MGLKKLVLMGLVCCTVFSSNGMAVLASGADAQAVVEEDKKDITVPENEAEEAGADAGVQKGQAEEPAARVIEEDLTEETANLMSILESSITSSVSATIENEEAKLPEYTQEDLMYLACIIYCEAGSQEKKGKIAVANVIMNRVESDIFDHVTTIREAIYDCDRWGRQFSPVYVKSNGKWTTKGSNYEKMLTMYQNDSYDKEWQRKQMEDCIAAAKEALEGKQVIDGSYLYFNMRVSDTKAKCKKKGASYSVIGCHIFY